MIRREFFKTALAAIAGWFGVRAVAGGKPSKPAVGQVWLRRGDKTRAASLYIIHFQTPEDPTRWGVADYTVDSSCRSDELEWYSADMWSQEDVDNLLPNWEYMGTLREFVGRGKVGM